MFVAPLLQGLTLGLLLSISIGPIIFAIIKQSVRNGYKGGFSFVAGVSVSDITLVIISNLFTEFFRSLLEYKTPIALGGSGLLIVLGFYVIFFKKLSVNEDGELATNHLRKRDTFKIFVSGFFMNILNPGVIAFWLFASTTFVAYEFSFRTIMFTTCLIFVLLTDVAKVLLAGRIRQKLTLKNIILINNLSGLILIGFGVAIIWGLLTFGDKIN